MGGAYIINVRGMGSDYKSSPFSDLHGSRLLQGLLFAAALHRLHA